jgi:hypothetical protein
MIVKALQASATLVDFKKFRLSDREDRNHPIVDRLHPMFPDDVSPVVFLIPEKITDLEFIAL